ncbi:hypothetical protein [Methylobacterium sp. GC_Met_2]|uniref:hypothetical protein n=1 Tax=Methylobacterium sp. GC_Met_2 TaxID=2937376 RepID=UPI00226B503C|nr:hypothetical protein [Methylobacterium sp. GC_Met_2]
MITPFVHLISEIWYATNALPNRVEATYRRDDLLAKRREMMEQWAAFCEEQSKAPSDSIGGPSADGAGSQ